MDKNEIVNNVRTIRKIIRENIIPVLNDEAGLKSSEDSPKPHFSYVQQRAMINQVFASTSGDKYSVQSIMLRLIVIDSLYSTNAAYSYFSFEHMANEIYDLGKEEDAADKFYRLVINYTSSGIDTLFTSPYGVRKNLAEGSRQMSLMSKYAYYVLLQCPDKYPLGFPIYDSLAINMYPEVYKNVKGTKNRKFSKAKLADTKTISIKDYIEALNDLRVTIFGNNEKLFDGYQQYDLLDAYLWRMGKLDKGNYSLLFIKREYETFVKNIGLKGWKDSSADEKKQSDAFNKEVRARCVQKDTKEILKGLSNKCMSALINHWKDFYK